MVSALFLIEAGALKQLGLALQSETSALAAFDAVRLSIYEIAHDIYSATRQTTYRITENCK